MIDTITQYILSIVPAVTAIVGMVVMIGVGIGKIKASNRNTVDAIKTLSKKSVEVQEELASTKKENSELRQALKKIVAKLDHVHFVDKED